MHGDEILELLLVRCDLFYFLKWKMDLHYKKRAVVRLAHHPLCATNFPLLYALISLTREGLDCC